MFVLELINFNDFTFKGVYQISKLDIATVIAKVTAANKNLLRTTF